MSTNTLVREILVDPARQISRIITIIPIHWKDPKHIFKKLLPEYLETNINLCEDNQAAK
jgi:hypothetical protein